MNRIRNLISSTACRCLLMLVMSWLLSSNTVMAQEPRDNDEFHQAAQQVMQDPEFRHLVRQESEKFNEDELPKWLKDALEWFKKLFERDREPQSQSDWSIPGIATILSYLAIALIVAALVYLLVSVLSRIEASKIKRPFSMATDEEAINPSLPPGEYAPEIYERRAVEFAALGDYRSALRELVLGSMSWVERASLIRHRRGLTNRDYVRAIWRDVDRRDSMTLIVDAFDRVFFGRRIASCKQFESCHRAFQTAFLFEESLRSDQQRCDVAEAGAAG